MFRLIAATRMYRDRVHGVGFGDIHFCQPLLVWHSGILSNLLVDQLKIVLLFCSNGRFLRMWSYRWASSSSLTGWLAGLDQSAKSYGSSVWWVTASSTSNPVVLTCWTSRLNQTTRFFHFKWQPDLFTQFLAFSVICIFGEIGGIITLNIAQIQVSRISGLRIFMPYSRLSD